MRRIATVALSLAIGLAVSLLPAAYAIAFSPVSTEREDLPASRWPIEPLPGGSHQWPPKPWDVEQQTGFGISILRAVGHDEVGRGIMEQWVVWAGWPFRSLWCERFKHYVPKGGPSDWHDYNAIGTYPLGPGKSWREGIELPESWYYKTTLWARRAFPLMPYWPGLLGNVAFFSAATLAVLWMLRAARTTLRRWRGHCGRCGYPVGSSVVCSECGSALPQRRGSDSPAAQG